MRLIRRVQHPAQHVFLTGFSHMSGPFDSPLALLDRANFHITELEEQIRKAPLAVSGSFTEMDAPGVNVRFKVKVESEIPVSLAVVVFDVFGELRSALDHAVYAAAIGITGNPDPSGTKFPFGKDADTVRGNFNQNKSLTEALSGLRELCVGFEAYPAGWNELVWGLNQMRNKKMHRALAVMAVSSEQVGFSGGESFQAKGLRTLSSWDAETKELTFMTMDELIGDTPKSDPLIQLSLADTTAFPNRPLISLLKDLSGRITEIVMIIQQYAGSPASDKFLNFGDQKRAQQRALEHRMFNPPSSRWLGGTGTA